MVSVLKLTDGGVGFSDNVIFRKQYYIQAMLEPEFGLYVSLNGGREWKKFTNDFPTVRVDDILVHFDDERSAAALETTLGPENRAAVGEALANVRAVSAELEGTRQRADALLDSLNATVDENRPEIRQAVVDLQHTVGAVAQRIEAITHHLESSSRNFDEFTREIRRNPNRLLFTAPADEVE